MSGLHTAAASHCSHTLYVKGKLACAVIVWLTICRAVGCPEQTIKDVAAATAFDTRVAMPAGMPSFACHRRRW